MILPFLSLSVSACCIYYDDVPIYLSIYLSLPYHNLIKQHEKNTMIRSEQEHFKMKRCRLLGLKANDASEG